MDYTDQQVVAAFNACLDLTKWAAVPGSVKERFYTLLRRKRVQAVCFMETNGLGLRVYHDGVDPQKLSGDEVLTTDHGVQQVSTDGHWLRCPGELFTSYDPRLVMNDRGSNFFVDFFTKEDFDQDGCNKDQIDQPRWGSRARAKRMTKEEAEKVAEQVGGLVVKP